MVDSLRRIGFGRIPKKLKFNTSGQYWEDRYAAGGNSGDGSYGDLAEYKASRINKFHTINDTLIQMKTVSQGPIRHDLSKSASKRLLFLWSEIIQPHEICGGNSGHELYQNES